MFTISEKINLRRKQSEPQGVRSNSIWIISAQIDAASLHARPGCVLVAVRDSRRMDHLKRVLEKTNLRRHDIVVMTVRQISTGAGGIRSLRETNFQRLRKGTVQPRGRGGREGRQAGGIAGGARARSLRRDGAGGEQPAGVAPGDRRQRAHELRRSSRKRIGLRVGATARTAPSFLARNHQPRPRFDVREPGSASASFVAGRCGSVARIVAAALRGTRSSARRLHHRDMVGVALRRLQRDLVNQRPRWPDHRNPGRIAPRR